MTLFLADPDFSLYNGDALEVLTTLEDGSVQMCVTSPPFYGLRDYGTGSWVGGDPDCDHDVKRWEGPMQTQGAQSGHASAADRLGRDVCGKCGASRVDQQIGLEETPEAWCEKLVGVFREVRRVLRADGTLWVEVGDSYASQPKGNPEALSPGLTNMGRNAQQANQHRTRSTVTEGLKPKDLIGAPWMLAFALRADGWYLRSDIVWSRPNPMPESVTDRPTKSHSYIFMLSKSKSYFWDQEAIREAHAYDWTDNAAAMHRQNSERRATIDQAAGGIIGSGGRDRQYINGPNPAGRNVRSVWDIPTQPYPEAHFATYPEELVRRCILAGSREGDTVLDPFCGSGTTALVARKHGRRTIGIELSRDYCDLAARRLQQQSLFA